MFYSIIGIHVFNLISGFLWLDYFDFGRSLARN